MTGCLFFLFLTLVGTTVTCDIKFVSVNAATVIVQTVMNGLEKLLKGFQ